MQVSQLDADSVNNSNLSSCFACHHRLYASCHACLFVQQGVLTPFDRLDGYERKIQSGPAEAGQSADINEPSAGACYRLMHCVLTPHLFLCIFTGILLLLSGFERACHVVA